MASQVTELSPVLVEVKVEVPWTQVNEALEDTYNKLQKTARIRGFRPGKVPRNVVKQVYGQQVRGEVAQQLVERGIMDAVKEHELSAVAVSDVDAKPFEDSQPLAFTAKIEVRPKVEKVVLEGLEVEKPVSTVDDKAVDAEITRLREENAVVRVIDPPRAAKAGDLLVVDYTLRVGDEYKVDLAANDRPIELGSDRLLPEFNTGLVGAKLGETKDIVVKFPEDHGRDDLKGKEGTFAITLKEHREKLLPELDDDFAKDCGPFKTLLELRLDVRKKLEEAASSRAESDLKERLVDKLVELNPIPVPPSLIEQQERVMMRDFANLLRMAGGADMPMTEELHHTMHTRAERKVRAAIVMGELARQEKLEIAPGDVEKKLEEIAQRTGKHIAKVRVEYQGDRREQLEAQVLEGKILDYLTSKAKIVDAPAKAGGEK